MPLGLPDAVHVHNPDIGRMLPVYVADEYEGFDAVPFADLDDAAVERYLEANVAAVEELVASARRPDVALANHLIMGPAILARALGGRVPYAVKVHGSALEYTVRPHRERFLPYALEGLRGAAAVLVGSRHTAESLWEVMGDPDLPARTRLGPARRGRARASARRPEPRPPRRSTALAARLEHGADGGLGRRAGRRRRAARRSTRAATGS